MLVMSLLVLGISLLKDVMNLLLEVLDPFNKFGCTICLGLECGRTLLVKMQHEELPQWGLMVGTPSTPEKGCGQ
jgi:hypothetical protein